jgi:hypothetical protein
MSLEECLEHGRSLGDEALIDDDWSLLFTSNAPHVNAGLCTGIFFARSKSDSCGILRNWWDANWPDKSRWSWEQGAMADGVHLHNRAYGARVRVLPTSHTWRAEDIPKLRHLRPQSVVIHSFITIARQRKGPGARIVAATVHHLPHLMLLLRMATALGTSPSQERKLPSSSFRAQPWSLMRRSRSRDALRQYHSRASCLHHS